VPAKNNFSWLAELSPGAELGVSGWHRVTQEDITAFGCLTRDEDPFHVDPEWAVNNSTLGTAIAFGFQTLSMLTFFLHQVFDQRGIEPGAEVQLFNFGFNRVRLPEPVPEGAEVRGRFAFSGSRVRESGGVEITLDAVVEIRNNDRPALVAEWLLVVPGPS
jgi:acyl dehydratase